MRSRKFIVDQDGEVNEVTQISTDVFVHVSNIQGVLIEDTVLVAANTQGQICMIAPVIEWSYCFDEMDWYSPEIVAEMVMN